MERKEGRVSDYCDSSGVRTDWLHVKEQLEVEP